MCADGFSWGDLCCCKQSLCCSTLPHQQSSSVFPEPVGSSAKHFGHCAVGHRIRSLMFLPLCPCSLVSCLYLGSFARSQGPLVWRCHGARCCAALFGSWLLDGTLCRGSWSGASSFPSSIYPLSHSVCLCHSLFTPAIRWKKVRK